MGVIINTPTPWCWENWVWINISKEGMRKASVLPEPVLAVHIMFLPFIATGIHLDWTSVAIVNNCLWRDDMVMEVSFIEEKEISEKKRSFEGGDCSILEWLIVKGKSLNKINK